MNQTIQHCPKCGAMQANQPTCGVCGARLPGFSDSERPGALIDRRVAVSVGLYVLAFMGGLVALTAMVLWLVFALF